MTDARGGSLFDNHPAIQQATVNITDPNHPATQGIPANWVRTDEWYNFTKEPTGVHVLAKLDESTYDEDDGTPEADDHPIAGARTSTAAGTFYTALGHSGTAWQEPDYRKHILGGDRVGRRRRRRPTAARRVTASRPTRPSTRSRSTTTPRTRWRSPSRPVATSTTSSSPARSSTTTRRPARSAPSARSRCIAATRTACSASRWTRTSPPTSGCTSSTARRRLRSSTSRASPSAPNGTVDMASEKVLLKIPHQRIVCCHSPAR